MIYLALSLREDKQIDAAEEAASRVVGLLPVEGNKYSVCDSYHLLDVIYHSKGDTKEAIDHLEVALGIASTYNWHDQLFDIHYSLGRQFLNEGRFNDAHVHVEQAKSHAAADTRNLGRAMVLGTYVWHKCCLWSIVINCEFL